MLTANQIKELIATGENSALEFKSSMVSPDSLAQEIVAFSNYSGGTIFLGVEDNGAITGIDTDKEEWVMNIVRQNVISPVNIQYYKVEINKKIIGVIEVPRGKHKPYQTNKFQYLIRVGSTNRVASHLELMRLFQQSGFFHFDTNAVDDTDLSDLNIQKIDKYFQLYEIDFIKEPEISRLRLLTNTSILSKNGNVTVAGLLIFGINPQRYLHNASISFAHFTGLSLDEELIDKQIIEGNLDWQIDQALSVIKNNIKKPSVIQGAKTVDTKPQIPDKVFRELITNAVIHRNYSIWGSRIRILMFVDRIEFHSPGKLPNSVTIDQLADGVSYNINTVILKFMENLRYIDKLGRGLPMVCIEASKLNKKVEFKEFGEEFIVTLCF